jgi:putative FmdB family regulatory protein
MPTYEYECTTCGRRSEVVQSFTDPALTTCEECGGPLRKVFGSVGVVFKGSGFYKTDSRGTTKSATSTKPEPATSSGESSTPAAASEPASSGSATTSTAASSTTTTD